ncbi:glycosyltransferase, partial [Planctomycetota bacterium]
FHLVDNKVTIRRVHIEQSSTTNMIHCRYDAAKMVNYYLEHFHLLEMYRYFNLNLDDDIDRFAEHFIGRMSHTETCINHPLIQEKFWKWFDQGLTALAPDIQIKILRKCLGFLNRSQSATYKIGYYIKQCLVSLSKERNYVPFAPVFNVEGRDIRHYNQDNDEFIKDLFDYGTDLLINEHTPLFAQKLYFHNTNKLVDTPFKLAHSAFRFISQLPNPYREIVEPYVDMSQIPLTQEEAIGLFVKLRYPEYADAFQKSLAFDPDKSTTLDEVEEHEKLISRMPQKYKQDLQQVCRKNPTVTILHYWNALALAQQERFYEAFKEAWKTLTLNHRSCDWRIAFKLGLWAEKANNFNEALRAYSMGCGYNPSFGPLADGLNRVLQQSRIFSQYVPLPKPFISVKEKNEVPSIKVSDCKITPLFDGNYIFDVIGISENGNSFNAGGKLSYSKDLKNIRFTDPYTNKRVTIAAESIFNLWSGGYDFKRETFKSYKGILKNNEKISVAFTIRNSSVLGGGPKIIYRYINWLSDLGLDVTVYSNDVAPRWAEINAKFHHIVDDIERYSSIKESVVIAYSVLELPLLLRYCNTKDKRIFHICQAVEDFHHCGSTIDSLITPKPIFEILHSLPVGRLGVSAHIHDFFDKQYNQHVHTIINGIDLNNYKQRSKRYLNDRINVLIIGNPKRLLKGSSDVKEAMMLLAKKHPQLKLHLTIASGNKATPNYTLDSSNLGFTQSSYWDLNTREMRDLYYDADVYINSAWYEGFGLPTIEAMACGVPVIQVDNQGLDGIVKDRYNCLMVPPQNPQRIVEALEVIIEDHKLRDSLINNALKTASGFSLENQYDMFIKEFQSILNCKFDDELIREKRRELATGSIKDRLKKISASLRPLISVLIHVNNQAEQLKMVLDSLIEQTYAEWEAIVVNDGSTDDTPF